MLGVLLEVGLLRDKMLEMLWGELELLNVIREGGMDVVDELLLRLLRLLVLVLDILFRCLVLDCDGGRHRVGRQGLFRLFALGSILVLLRDLIGDVLDRGVLVIVAVVWLYTLPRRQVPQRLSHRDAGGVIVVIVLELHRPHLLFLRHGEDGGDVGDLEEGGGGGGEPIEGLCREPRAEPKVGGVERREPNGRRSWLAVVTVHTPAGSDAREAVLFAFAVVLFAFFFALASGSVLAGLRLESVRM